MRFRPPPLRCVGAVLFPSFSCEASMRAFLSLTAAAFLLIAAGAKADEQADLQKVIDKAIKAHGADKADKKKAHTFKIKGTVHVMGMDLEFTGDYQVQDPDKVRQVTTTTVMGNEFKYML